MLGLEAPMPVNLEPPIAILFYWGADANIEIRVNLSDFAVYILI